MTETTIILLLLLYIIAREAFFLYSTHKFVNKIMSHNYHDYTQSVKAGNAPPAPKTVQLEDEPVEDLGVLQGLGIM